MADHLEVSAEDVFGANGKTIDVTVGWIRNNDGVVRLLTAIPTPR